MAIFDCDIVAWLADLLEKMTLQMYCWFEHLDSWSSQTGLLRRATDVMWDRSFFPLLQVWRPPKKWTHGQIQSNAYIILHPLPVCEGDSNRICSKAVGGRRVQKLSKSWNLRRWIGQELSKTGAQDAALCRRIAKKLQVHLPPWRSWNFLFGMHVIPVLVLRHRQVRGFEFLYHVCPWFWL